LDVANYKPAGKSPLEDHPTFKYYQKVGTTHLRECDTLDTFMCSSFYFLRFVDPHNPDQLAGRELLDQTMPVDFYIGGKEHTVGHLIYSRFIHKFLYDQGFVGCPEPFQRLFHQGMVLAHDGRKMSKRRGNVITPDEIIDVYGSDTLRMYELFM
jgi:leucyl-tRNA synthetase